MFFGAGNLIFPVSMGQMAGRHVWQAAAGFLITGVGLPLLGVAALGISRKSGLLGLGTQVGRKYGILFTCALYLTIGPFFAIPRCATVSYTDLRRGRQAVFSRVFPCLFCSGIVFLSAAGRDHDMDRKSDESFVPRFSCCPCHKGAQ